MKRGTLRVYLGAAPGVGKTFAMLNEGRRAAKRGIDVVVGFVETHNRPRTAAAVGDLEIVPRRHMVYRDRAFEEMDVDAILARRPDRALVDELAHTNVPGSRSTKRWQDVSLLLDAGIDVISTVNIQHLESLNDVVERITGIRQRETVPDEVVRAADQVELVDLTPEALRRRLAHGNIYAPDKIDAALANYFREGNLGALRELALLWVADKVDVGLEQYRERHGITQPWETRERVAVALTGAPGTENLIRRAARITQRAHGELLGVHVVRTEGLAGPPPALVERHRQLLVDMGGVFHQVSGPDVAEALTSFARAENATQVVLGASQRSKWSELARGSVINRVIRRSGEIDVHVISHSRPEEEGSATAGGIAGPRRRWQRRGGGRPRPPSVSTTRLTGGWVLALIGVPVLTLVLAQLREMVGLSTVLLGFLALVVAAAACGGRWPAVAAAGIGFASANWYFTPPFYRWTIAEGENAVALVAFLGIGLVVGHLVDSAARRRAEAIRAQAEARTLASLAATMGQADPLAGLLEHLRSVFDLSSVALLRRQGPAWVTDAVVGGPAPVAPEEAEVTEELSDGLVLALSGHRLAASDRLVLKAFAAQLSAVVENNRLRVEAGRSRSLEEANALRSALLQAVSHDLRTPLAAIKASVSTLRQQDVSWSEDQTKSFLRTIESETDRLSALVANLLDMGRIQAGALRPQMCPVALEEVVPAAIASLGDRAPMVRADISEALPAVVADAALLERALANVIDNATRFTPAGHQVKVEAGSFSGRIDVRVIDRGPGIPRPDRDQLFAPFQRLGDSHPGGVGLGLAVARGFLDALGATIEIDDTPGGGTTMVISLPVAP
ncbi:MAG: DUF4118 domain-containing protein [Acidimicrobiales bacterium]